MTKLYRADLHVHSSHSNKPSIWAMRKLNCPESYTTPEFIYRTAREKGMDYVTITDHNTINGAVEIAHLPGAFISSEITAYFPEDGCKIHVIVLDISEETFRELMELRKNVYELIDYLHKNGISHFVAHPLYDMNGKLSLATIEKMILLFDAFEVKNGARASRYNEIIGKVISSLHTEIIEALSERHGIVPHGERPWEKAVVGGSDDHSGFFIGRAYTISPEGKTLKEFIRSIMEKKTLPAGEDGDILSLAHSIYGIGYRFYTERIKGSKKKSMPFVNMLMDRFVNVSIGDPRKSQTFWGANGRLSLVDRIKLFVSKNVPELYGDYDGTDFEEVLDREAKRLLNDRRFLESISSEDKNRSIFSITSHLANRMAFIYTSKLMKTPLSSGFFQLLRSLSTICIIHLLISPYYLSYYHQHRSKKLISTLDDGFCQSRGPATRERIALFTDTLHEINGVAITIKRLIETSRARGVDLTVITCGKEETVFKNGIMSFKSTGDFSLPEYPGMSLHFPPILDVIDYVEREGFTSIHASTPGSLGLLALFIAKLLDIPISATYHTDIPQYVRDLTNDMFMENTAWNYIIWLYNQMKDVMVPSKNTEQQLIERGLQPEKLKPLPRWVDTAVFSPEKRDPLIWNRYNMNGEVKFLYVGRVSKEKNLELLTDAFIVLSKRGLHGYLIVVGDGPYRAEMEERLRGYPVIFTGFLRGDELSTVYASSDVFVFPSTTDTFGNVVLEAQASGLPVIVSDRGGPSELMKNEVTGYVISADYRSALIEKMSLFICDRDRIIKMGREARRFIEMNAPDEKDVYRTILSSNKC